MAAVLTPGVRKAGPSTEDKNRQGRTMFIGGVATQRGMVKSLEQRLGIKVEVPNDCEYVCALGAAYSA